jgi:hypothetical protein
MESFFAGSQQRKAGLGVRADPISEEPPRPTYNDPDRRGRLISLPCLTFLTVRNVIVFDEKN